MNIKRWIAAVLRWPGKIIGFLLRKAGFSGGGADSPAGVNLNNYSQKFLGYRCMNCGSFFAQDEFGHRVDVFTSTEIRKPFQKYSDEYQKHKPVINNPDKETTDYCPECSSHRKEIRRFKLIYSDEENDEM